MSTFAISSTADQGELISALNYALANLGTVGNTGGGSGNGNVFAGYGNVVTANANTGVVSSVDSGVISYLYGYVNFKYANNATGSSGFSSNSQNRSYYGINNTTNGTISSNPVDYSWTQVSGGFGTTKSLWFQTLGGAQIKLFAGNAAPTITYASVLDDSAIPLVQLANSVVVANSVSTGAITTTGLYPSAATQTINAFDNSPYPVINWVNGNATINGTGYIWPNFTRGFAIGGGATITTTTNGSVTGSKITVNYNAYITSATDPEYNLIELWKSGSSKYYKETFRIVRADNTLSSTNDDYFITVGDNGGMYKGNIGNIQSQITNTTNNLFDGISSGDAGAYYAFGQSGTYLYGTQDNSPSFVGNIPGAIAAYGGVGSAYPLYNMFGACQIAWIEVGAPTTKLPTIIVGSSGTIGFWTGFQNAYSGGLFAFESSGTFAELNDIVADTDPNLVSTSNPSPTVNYVVVGSSGTILYNARTYYGYTSSPASLYGNVASTTGWSQADSGTIVNLNGVMSNWAITYPETSANLWVAVGDQGTILHSTSGSGPWVAANSVPTTNNLNAVGFANGYWVAVGDAGTIVVSTDADNWTGPIANPADGSNLAIGVRNLYGVAGGYNQGTFVAAGEEIILTSDTTVPTGSWNSNAYLGGSSLNSTLTRLQYFGSWSNVADVSNPPASQRITNQQVVSGTYTDIDYVENQNITYYLVLGNMAGNVVVTTNGPNMTVTEFKR